MKQLRDFVSVPYRGATFLNRIHDDYCKNNTKVSVPYRGATFLNAKPDRTLSHGAQPVSVPYRGATFLNYYNRLYCTSYFCFRPLSGSYISQYFPKSFLVSLESFRPLSGSYISQLLSQILSKPVIQFPSPIGELHFSIFHPVLRLSL